ncbi:MAG: hypothetical protein KC910_34415, partial [Candidatus Eremiobacteraeota bacterium]|nr:hypothetical protein [Candidatus Eremiobacteraeota bacterium]
HLDDRVVRQWGGGGVGVHLGIGMSEPEGVVLAQRLLAPKGFLPAAFMNGGPLTNQAQDILVLYLDRAPLRLEFYFSRSEAS